MVFISKKDSWMGLIIWVLIAAFLWVFYQSVFVQTNIIGIVAMVIMVSLLVVIWFNTRYKIEGNQLHIYYGPIKISINLQDIQSIRQTKNPFVAPALSMNRVEINYEEYKTIQVSPKLINEFISEIKKKNPEIQVES